MTEHIVAVFETVGAAEAAEAALQSAGIAQSAMRRYPQSSTNVSQTSGYQTSGAGGSSGGGFWAWLLGEEPAGATTHQSYGSDDAYERWAASGRTVLSVTLADDSQIHTAVSVLEAHHPVDLEESTQEETRGGTSASTRGEALTPTLGETPALRPGLTTAGVDRSTDATLRGSDVAGTAPGVAGTGRTTTPTGTRGGEEVIPLAEEQLEIGKRMVDKGSTRVRRYVVERPVEEQVTLRGERVTVERRRPVGAQGAPGEAAFEERVVDVQEREEVPVVQKAARVVEEVVVKREGTERTETVHDKVRRDDVEISGGTRNEGSEPQR